MPRLPKGKKSPSDDDPFWDSWDEEPIAKENRAPLRRAKTKKTTMNAACDDPFGRDGFGDSWDYKPSAKFDCDDHDDAVPQEDFSSAEFDWGTCLRQETRRDEEIQRKRAEREERLSQLKKKREAAAKAVAAEAEAEAAAKTAAEEKWQIKVEQATDCIALGDPSQALTILYSLSIDNEILEYIDIKEKKEVSQMYAALYNHFELQHYFSSFFDRSNNEIDESIGGKSIGGESIDDETTIGGDTIKVNQSTEDEESNEIQIGSATVVVDRLPASWNSETETKTEESSSSNTVGGGTAKVVRSPSGDHHCNTEVKGEDSEEVGHSVDGLMDRLQSVERDGDSL